MRPPFLLFCSVVLLFITVFPSDASPRSRREGGGTQGCRAGTLGQPLASGGSHRSGARDKDMGAADLFGKDPRASHAVLVVKNLPANVGDARDTGSILRSRRSPGGGHGDPLQCSWLENPMDRGAWWAAVHGVTQSQTWLKRLSTQARTEAATQERAREMEKERKVAQLCPDG